METSVVQYGRTQIPYRVRRSARRRTVAVSVAAGEGVVLTAPRDTPVSRLDRVVHTKAQWIVERLHYVGQLNGALPPREFVSGESFLYLGRHYRLKVEVCEEYGPTRLEYGWLRVQVKDGLAAHTRAAATRVRLVHWYKHHAAPRLEERVRFWHGKVGVAMPTVVVRDQQKRWGSCDTRGLLRFNWRIIQASMRLVDYVVVHELTHLLHHGHTRAYWAIIGRVMPDYEARKETLRRLGAALVW